MKIVSAHQPAYLPWLGYFHKLMICDHFIIMDDVQFEKNSFINRNKVLVNGAPVMLTIPVRTADYTLKRVKEIQIADERWKAKHLRTIEQSYKKFVFFHEVFPFIERGLCINSKFLVDYTNSILIDLIKYLGIETRVSFASELDIRSRKLGYVIELTKKLDAQLFVFGAQGKFYADEDEFAKNNLLFHYQEYNHPMYEQSSKQFIPYLSVLDLLVRFGRESLRLISANNVKKADLLDNA